MRQGNLDLKPRSQCPAVEERAVPGFAGPGPAEEQRSVLLEEDAVTARQTPGDRTPRIGIAIVIRQVEPGPAAALVDIHLPHVPPAARPFVVLDDEVAARFAPPPVPHAKWPHHCVGYQTWPGN